MKKLVVSLASLLLCCGCVKTVVQSDNVTVTTTRFLWPGKIGEASVTTSNKTTLKIKGYSSDSQQLVESIAQGITQGMAASAK